MHRSTKERTCHGGKHAKDWSIKPTAFSVSDAKFSRGAGWRWTGVLYKDSEKGEDDLEKKLESLFPFGIHCRKHVEGHGLVLVVSHFQALLEDTMRQQPRTDCPQGSKNMCKIPGVVFQGLKRENIDFMEQLH